MSSTASSTCTSTDYMMYDESNHSSITCTSAATGTITTNQKKKICLFDYTEQELLHDNVLTHYEVLNIAEYATSDDVKKAYRKASLRYHPDKTGRGTDDYVFLAVKAAHDVLFDPAKRQAYDSTVMPFDDAIPPPRSQLMAPSSGLLYTDDDFYATFGPVFQRNLRFDARLRPDLKKSTSAAATTSSSTTTKTAAGGNKRNKGGKKPEPPPSLGDADTSLAQVHKFYEYWIHFESWRDFSAQAADELQVENELENAESRFEKRWIQKEIDKRAKQLKKQEMARIQTLVERAMEADPRLRAERIAEQRRKEEAKLRRELEARRKKEQEEQRKRELEAQRQKEEERKAEEKAEREKEKKQLRKARQQLRKMTSASFDEVRSLPSPSLSPSGSEFELWKDAYDMNQDVDLLCTSLNLVELRELNQSYEQESNAPLQALFLIQQKVESLKKEQEKQAIASTATETKETETPAKTSNARPWTKDELSALAKAVKKYPPGGASRWEQIALFVNNLCKQKEPRSKEECIEKFNNVARNAKSSTAKSNAANTDAVPKETATISGDADDWTPEQDKQLQDGLAQYPASMDKNERWTNIAKVVTGKTKKQCVQRFKAIREALLAGRE